MFERIEGLVCWQCGTSLAALSLPLRRQDTCKSCGAELHACRLCEFYDTSVAKSCREPVAEEVRDKTRANFCDYFKPRPHAFRAASAEADRAKSELENLFGGPSNDATPGEGADDDRARLEALFGGKSKP